MSKSTLHIEPEACDGQPLLSDYAEDPGMAELIRMFVRDLPQRMEAIEHAVRDGDFQQVASLAHQLKGGAGGYGFNPITDAARQVERCAGEAHARAELPSAIEALAKLCRRATAR